MLVSGKRSVDLQKADKSKISFSGCELYFTVILHIMVVDTNCPFCSTFKFKNRAKIMRCSKKV